MPPPGTPEVSRPDFSPEARRREALRLRAEQASPYPPHPQGAAQVCQIIRRVVLGTYHDGSIHAGNFAYLSMLAIFPCFILGAAIFSAIGEEGERFAAIAAILSALPPMVAEVIRPVAYDVVAARSGWLLWAGGLFGLWAVSGLVETIRDILRRAYGTRPTRAFWKYRLLSAAITMGAMVLLIFSLTVNIIIGATEEFVAAYMPELENALSQLSLSRIIPVLALFGSLYLLFFTLTPDQYRVRNYSKWPGALLVTAWMTGVTLALPPLLRSVFSYSLVYGSLAGIVISLLFFWLVGLGVVMGAELNAALVETPEEKRA